ncbi:hypothetical protein ACHAXN_000345 [Cyclotella atomus]
MGTPSRAKKSPPSTEARRGDGHQCCNSRSIIRLGSIVHVNTVSTRNETHRPIQSQSCHRRWPSTRGLQYCPLAHNQIVGWAHVLEGLKPKALLSVKTLADNGYTTIFHPHDQGVTVHGLGDFELTLKSPALLQGWRKAGGLWTVPIVDKPTSSPALTGEDVAMNVYELPSTKEVVRFLHAALGFPTKATLLTAIRNGNLVTFPALNVSNVTKHFPESDETQKGHMKQSKQGVRSTKVIDEDAMLKFKPTPGVKHKDVYLRVFDATKKAMYLDQTGKFPIPSSQGNKYIMVAVELDGNYIDAEPLKTQGTESLIKVYQAIFS